MYFICMRYFKKYIFLNIKNTICCAVFQIFCQYYCNKVSEYIFRILFFVSIRICFLNTFNKYFTQDCLTSYINTTIKLTLLFLKFYRHTLLIFLHRTSHIWLEPK